MKTALERKLRASLNGRDVPHRSRLVVGVSGGADSIALADALAREHEGHLTIAHLNHLLRGDESDRDADFVGSFASKLRILSDPEQRVAFIMESQDITARAQTESRNLEAVARDARYDFFARTARATQSVFAATAHTRDDQVETICMRLMRGTGPEGLRGIHAARSLGPLCEDVTLIRPLLEVTRAEVLEHCAARHLDFRSDSSNFSKDLQRNRVRHDLLPHLRSFNPRLDEALLRMAALVAEDDEELSGRAAQVLGLADEGGGSLNLRVVGSEHPALRRRVLRVWLRNGRGDLRRIDQVHLAAVERLMMKGEGGRGVELPGGFKVRKRGSSLVLEKTNPAEIEGVGTEQNPERFGKK
ncbi:MAG: tRNA lysidine(34) synthetase TilS [Acidobacteriota bacterium]